MNRGEYTDAVLAQLRRVTGDERESIRAELDAHMEDHICALRDLGYDEQLAEERTLALMGDPVAVGKELSKIYTGWGWVLLSRLAVLLTAVLCIQALLGLGVLSNLLWSIQARTVPDEIHSDYTAAATLRPDIRIPVGNDVLRVYRVSVGTEDGVWAAEVATVAYDRIPGGVVSSQLLGNVVLEDQRGLAPEHRLGGGGKSNFGADYSLDYLPVEPGDTFLTLRYDRLGEHVAVEIPLPEVEP